MTLREMRRELVRHIEGLRIQPGDVLVVKDALLMERIQEIQWPDKIRNLRTPILFAPDGLEKVDVSVLEEALAAARTSQVIVVL